MQTPTKITGTVRDFVSAYVALTKLTEKRGMPDSATALSVGMTMRSLREVQEDSQESHKVLMTAHAARDDDGNIKRGADLGSVELDDPQAFLDESKKLLTEERSVKIWPLPIGKVIRNLNKKASICPRCKQQEGMPDPESYASLIVLGILFEEDSKKKDEVGPSDDDE